MFCPLDGSSAIIQGPNSSCIRKFNLIYLAFALAWEISNANNYRQSLFCNFMLVFNYAVKTTTLMMNFTEWCIIRLFDILFHLHSFCMQTYPQNTRIKQKSASLSVESVYKICREILAGNTNVITGRYGITLRPFYISLQPAATINFVFIRLRRNFKIQFLSGAYWVRIRDTNVQPHLELLC